MTQGWAAQYVGIPWKPQGRDHGGVDCWGLLRLVYREQFGIDLPSFTEDYSTDYEKAEIAALIAGNLKPAWQEIASGQEREGDAILLRVGGRMHVGIVVERGRMLHSHKSGAVCQAYGYGVWRGKAVGFYRWGLAVVDQARPGDAAGCACHGRCHSGYGIVEGSRLDHGDASRRSRGLIADETVGGKHGHAAVVCQGPNGGVRFFSLGRASQLRIALFSGVALPHGRTSGDQGAHQQPDCSSMHRSLLRWV